MVNLNRQINIFRDRAWRVITYNYHLGDNMSTGLYTLNVGADQRYMTFQTLLTTDEFINMAIVYNEFKIHKAVFTSLPTSNSNRLPYLYVDIEPSTSAGVNPNNVRVCADDSARIFAPKALSAQSCEWDLRGVGPNFNQWLDTGATIPGQFQIGNYIFGSIPINLGWEVKFQLVVEFTNPK